MAQMSERIGQTLRRSSGERSESKGQARNWNGCAHAAVLVISMGQARHEHWSCSTLGPFK